jgi:hypothetical membrane protein
MRISSERLVTMLRSPGLWLLAAGLELLLLVHLSEFLYPGYSTSSNYISDLGVGPALPSALFTAGVFLFGLMAIVAAALVHRRGGRSLLWVFLTLSGIGAVGVGAFNEDFISLVHRASALLAFLFGNLAALYSSKLARAPMSYVSGILGFMGLSALALYGGGVYLGLGIGGMERMILYPAMFWAIGYGAYLVADDGKTAG